MVMFTIFCLIIATGLRILITSTSMEKEAKIIATYERMVNEKKLDDKTGHHQKMSIKG